MENTFQNPKNTFDHAPIGIVITDGEGKIKYINSFTQKIFGFNLNELQGESIEILLPENLRKIHIGHRKDFKREPFSRPMGNGLDLVGRKKNGEVFPVEIAISYELNGEEIQIISYINDISKRVQFESLLASQKKRMEKELGIARGVQLAMLPNNFPSVKGWEFGVRWKPAFEVAGDFYDLMIREDGYFDFYVADVTDKGVPAALFMAQSRTLLRSSLQATDSLVDGVVLANQAIIRENVGPFVTLFLARINPKNGEMTYINGGHESALVYHGDKDEIIELPATGYPLGVDLDIVYEEKPEKLQRSDFIVLYTDGVPEAMDKDFKQFGKENMIQILIDNRHEPAEKVVEVLMKEVENHIGPTPPSDDIAILIAKRNH